MIVIWRNLAEWIGRNTGKTSSSDRDREILQHRKGNFQNLAHGIDIQDNLAHG